MKCPKCGADNPPKANQCLYCKTPLANVSAGKRSKTEWFIVGVITSLITVLFLTVGVYSLVTNRSLTDAITGKKPNSTYNVIAKQDGNKTTENKPSSYPSIETSDNPSGSDASDKTTKPSESEENTESSSIKEKEEHEIYENQAKASFEERAAELEEEESEFYENGNLSQAEMNTISYELYEKWDTLLNDIYKYLAETLPEDEFSELQKDERRWIEEKEKAVEEAGSEWEGGSAQPTIENTTAMGYTSDRCYYLMSLISE